MIFSESNVLIYQTILKSMFLTQKQEHCNFIHTN